MSIAFTEGPSHHRIVRGPKAAIPRFQKTSHVDAVLAHTVVGGLEKIEICFPAPVGQRSGQKFEITEWFEFPNLARAFADAFYQWGLGLRSRSREQRWIGLSRGFFDFLASCGAPRNLSLGDLSTEILTAFVGWLQQETPSGGPRWARGTCASRLSTLRTAVKWLRRSERYGREISNRLRVPRTPWSSQALAGKPAKVVDASAYKQLLRAAQSEIDDMRRWLPWIWERMQEVEATDGREQSIVERRAAYKYLPFCLIALAKEFPSPDTNVRQIRLKNPTLCSAILNTHKGLVRVKQYLYPTHRTLVPFILLLAAYTGLNPEILLGLRLSDIDYPDSLGGKRIRFSVFKPRSQRRQIHSFAVDEQAGPSALVRFIEQWSSRLRACVGVNEREHLFIHLTFRNEEDRIHTFYSEERDKLNDVWYIALRIFLKDHGLPKINLSEIRKTVHDVAHEIFDGDIQAVTAIGGQRSAQTVNDHYTSDAARQRNDERLVQIMATRERLVQKRGRAADPRKEGYAADYGAVTPGFRCYDPFNSPIAGERTGRLCQAYGACPKCELSHINVSDPFAAGRLLQLDEAIDSARQTMDAKRWVKVWAPRLIKLRQYWLPLFSKRCLDRVRNLTLSPLPEVE